MGVPIDPDRLRHDMAQRGLDGQQLAALAHVTPATISHALNHRVVALSTVRALARALVTTPLLQGADFLVSGGQGLAEVAARPGCPRPTENTTPEARQNSR
jgi:transcriptional regulator with XRE-family HTH domain